MGSFRDLKAWQYSHRLAVECGVLAKTFPAADRGVVADQLLRASSSVPLNIAEGCARKGAREFRRFLDTAVGSLAEMRSALLLAKDLGYVSEADYVRIEAVANEAGKTLWGLLRRMSLAATRRP